MGKELYSSSPVARDIFIRSCSILEIDLASVCFNGPEDRLNQTDISQPAIYVTSIASFSDAVAKKSFDPSLVTAYAGLSLGEYTALHLAGVFSFEDGLRLVKLRGKYMQEAAVASPSGMVAIIGADEPTVAKLCESAAQGDVLVPANFNAPGQIVVSGTLAACERIITAAEAGGFRTVPLKVAGAFHSPLMQPAADKMRDELARVKFQLPTKTVYSNVTAQPHTDVESIKRLLVEQIVKPVRWEQTMTTLAADAEARFIELSPGKTLTTLAKRINRRLPVEMLG